MVTILEGGSAEKNEWIGLIGFWVLSCIIAFAPLGSRLEVGKDYIKNYFFGFCTSTIKQEDVMVINYGNLFRGGLGYGKGLNIRVKNGFGKNHSIGEKLYGKEAIEHVRRILENKS